MLGSWGGWRRAGTHAARAVGDALRDLAGGTAVTTEQATVTIPGARIAPDAYAQADARAAEAMPGNIHPLGPSPGEQFGKVGTNFSIASSVAEGVTLCLFDENGAETQVPLRDNDADVWHAFVPGVGPG